MLEKDNGSDVSATPTKSVPASPATGKNAAVQRKKSGRNKAGEPAVADEEAINLNTLMELKEVFEKADVDGGGSLDLEEFVEAFGEILGKNMNQEQLRHLFMKIDANSDGGVDWDEFSNFVLLESQGVTSMRDGPQLEYVAQAEVHDANAKSENSCHRDMIDRILLLPHQDKYITTSRDGTVRVWNASNLNHIRAVKNGNSWITDAVHMTLSNKLAVSSVDRSISFYDASSMDCAGRIKDLENAPMALGYWPWKDKDMLAFGDDAGYVHVYHMYDGVLDGTKVFKHKTHKDWVTRVRYIADMASLVSSSLDNTIKIGDIERKNFKGSLEGHTKGVYSFDWCPTYKFFASCGLERHIVLWNPYTGKPMGTLTGHGASVQDVLINDSFNQLISVSVDKMIKVWDVRTQRCVQTILDKQKYRPENRISAIAYSTLHRCLVTGTTSLRAWPMQKKDSGDRKGDQGEQSHFHHARSHEHAVAAALFNRTFNEVVSADETAVVCVWDLESGNTVFRFHIPKEGPMNLDSPYYRISTMQFDKNGRRVLTGSADGQVKMWNFSNGACLKEFKHSGTGEITGICYIEEGQNKFIVAVGWDRLVKVWPEDNTYIVEVMRELRGHKEDILALAFTSPNILATCGFDGLIIIWNIDSGFQKCTLMAPNRDSLAEQERAVEKLIFLRPPRSHLLLSCGADGCIRVWNARDGEHCFSKHAQMSIGEGLISMCTDESQSFLVTADAQGYIKTWDISQLNPDPSHLSPMQIIELYHWRAHEQLIVSLDFVDSHKMVLTASTDGSISLWTIQGLHVGVFRSGCRWVLGDPSTYLAEAPVPVPSHYDKTIDDLTATNDAAALSKKQSDEDEEQPDTPMNRHGYRLETTFPLPNNNAAFLTSLPTGRDGTPRVNSRDNRSSPTTTSASATIGTAPRVNMQPTLVHQRLRLHYPVDVSKPELAHAKHHGSSDQHGTRKTKP